jgi:hypothetical protein
MPVAFVVFISRLVWSLACACNSCLPPEFPAFDTIPPLFGRSAFAEESPSSSGASPLILTTMLIGSLPLMSALSKVSRMAPTGLSFVCGETAVTVPRKFVPRGKTCPSGSVTAFFVEAFTTWPTFVLFDDTEVCKINTPLTAETDAPAGAGAASCAWSVREKTKSSDPNIFKRKRILPATGDAISRNSGDLWWRSQRFIENSNRYPVSSARGKIQPFRGNTHRNRHSTVYCDKLRMLRPFCDFRVSDPRPPASSARQENTPQ